DGEYTINLKSSNATILVSYVGYKSQEIQVANQNIIEIILIEDISSLDEVVVVGYGTTKKENLTAAVTQINANELGNRANTSIVQSLQGTMPGLNIKSNNGDPRQNAEI